MYTEAIGVRMAKLQNKLKYTDALAPSLRNLPDYSPTSKYNKYNIFNKIIIYIYIIKKILTIY